MLKRLQGWHKGLPGFVRGLITAAGVLLMAPVLVTMMKLLLFPRETPAMLDLLGEQSRTGFTFDLESLNKRFEDFSVYDGFENAEYDLTFLDYLN